MSASVTPAQPNPDHILRLAGELNVKVFQAATMASADEALPRAREARADRGRARQARARRNH